MISGDMYSDRIDAVLLEVARHCLRVTHQQLRSLELLAYLSKTLRLTKTGESKSNYAVQLEVEVDGGRRVDVDWDGSIELLEAA